MADASQGSNPNPQRLLARITSLRAQAAKIEAELQQNLNWLSDLLQAGEIDASFSFNDHSFNWSPGRTSWTYPVEVREIESILKTAKKTAEGNGSATPKAGTPFWTIRAPKP